MMEPMEPTAYTWAAFWAAWEAECLRQWAEGLRSPPSITLPEGVFPDLESVVNQVNGIPVPVRRVPMFEDEPLPVGELSGQMWPFGAATLLDEQKESRDG